MAELLPPSRDDVRLMLLHASAPRRTALAALFALDDRLAQVVRTTGEPIIGQMRIAWWRDAVAALDRAPAPAEPVLAAIAATVLRHGVAGEALTGVADGWEALIAEEIDLTAHAGRGRALFRAAAGVLGVATPGDAVDAAGEGWALADLARHLSDRGGAARAGEAAAERFAIAFSARWPAALRPLGLLALVERDAEAAPAARAWRAIRFRATGRG